MGLGRNHGPELDAIKGGDTVKATKKQLAALVAALDARGYKITRVDVGRDGSAWFGDTIYHTVNLIPDKGGNPELAHDLAMLGFPMNRWRSKITVGSFRTPERAAEYQPVAARWVGVTL